jgi:hypothetical protein
VNPGPRRRAPFLGLRFFDEGDAQLFCGRDQQVDDLLQKLAQARFVTVIGTSGCGKSSLVRAGLIPAVRNIGNWRIATLRPGGNPIGELAAALERTFSATGLDVTLRRGRLGLVEAVQQCQLAPGENLLVIVDQFEELFRFHRETGLPDEAAAFVKLIIEATAQRAAGVCVMITMRSDFLGNCSQFSDLPERINDGLYLVPRMRRDQLEQAITGPLRVSADPIAPRLIQRLLNDVGDDPDQLPVLQHVLLRTWTRWKEDGSDGPLDLQHYEHQAVGGLAQALERHANQIYAGLSESLQRFAEILFRRLTDVDEARAIRRPTSFQELVNVCGGDSQTENVRAVLEAFRAEGVSFLMPEAARPLESGTMVDITHESLIRQWKRLRDWAQLESADSSVYLEIEKRAGQAAGWEDHLTGVQLTMASDWLRRAFNAAWAARYGGDYERTVRYIEDSQQAVVEAAEAAQYRERLFILLVIVVLFVLCLEAEDLVSALAFAAIGVAWLELRTSSSSRVAMNKGGSA